MIEKNKGSGNSYLCKYLNICKITQKCVHYKKIPPATFTASGAPNPAYMRKQILYAS